MNTGGEIERKLQSSAETTSRPTLPIFEIAPVKSIVDLAALDAVIAEVNGMRLPYTVELASPHRSMTGDVEIYLRLSAPLEASEYAREDAQERVGNMLEVRLAGGVAAEAKKQSFKVIANVAPYRSEAV